MNLPGGGSVVIPEPYNRKPTYPTYAEKNHVSGRALIAYRNWRSTMSGYPECDGMIAVAHAAEFPSLLDFRLTAKGALSIQWSHGDEVASQPWGPGRDHYPVEERVGDRGPELLQLLSIHRVGILDVYDDPALTYAVSDPCSLNIGVWITKRQGGARKAHSIARNIAASFER